jgi:hypothetical protein
MNSADIVGRNRRRPYCADAPVKTGAIRFAIAPYGAISC